jgi:hypothetical protein
LSQKAPNPPSDQSPTGNSFLTTIDDWTNSKWDGIPINPCGKSNEELCQFIFPRKNTMRGVLELYMKTPFRDPKNPTASEIDAWNLLLVQHLRNLTGSTRPISNDKCLYLKAQWASERKWSTFWDSKYPTAIYDNFGPCTSSSKVHCGFDFQPSCEDQSPYLGATSCCPDTGKAEGLASVDLNIPWALKFVNVMNQFICNEGMTGHASVLWSCTRMGHSWTVVGQSVSFRGQWEDWDNFKACP